MKQPALKPSTKLTSSSSNLLTWPTAFRAIGVGCDGMGNKPVPPPNIERQAMLDPFRDDRGNSGCLWLPVALPAADPAFGRGLLALAEWQSGRLPGHKASSAGGENGGEEGCHRGRAACP